MKNNDRSTNRVPYQETCVIKHHDKNDNCREQTVLVLNLSAGGLAVESPADFTNGEKLLISFAAHSEDPTSICGYVRHCSATDNGNFTVGIEFEPKAPGA